MHVELYCYDFSSTAELCLRTVNLRKT